MKKIILSLIAVTTVTLQANALSASRSREEARFLTDKMAYELDLTDDQLQDIYEINYDYFRSLGPVDGIYDTYYDRRYTNLGYVLYDWQWREFLLRDYFIRPAYVYRGGWAFGVYNYYSRTHFFYGEYRVYGSYHGGHYHIANYYYNRRDMHHRAVAARPHANLHDRRPQMTRPNIGHQNGNMNRGHSMPNGKAKGLENNKVRQNNNRQGNWSNSNGKKNDFNRNNVASNNRSNRTYDMNRSHSGAKNNNSSATNGSSRMQKSNSSTRMKSGAPTTGSRMKSDGGAKMKSSNATRNSSKNSARSSRSSKSERSHR